MDENEGYEAHCEWPPEEHRIDHDCAQHREQRAKLEKLKRGEEPLCFADDEQQHSPDDTELSEAGLTAWTDTLLGSGIVGIGCRRRLEVTWRERSERTPLGTARGMGWVLGVSGIVHSLNVCTIC